MGRGQITVFIIIGIVLLLSIATLTYIYQSRSKAIVQRAVVVPEDAQQVYDYVVQCVDQISKEGLSTLGLQGGYIFLPPVIEKNPNSYVSSDSMNIFKTPLWYYEGEDRTPPLEFLKSELEMHVRLNLADCVDNFDSFRPTYDIYPLGNVTPVVTLGEEEVIVDVIWPLKIVTENKETDIKDFVKSYDLKLKQMWELADKTMKKENELAWFENLTIDLLASNPRIPLTGMEIYCGTKKWHLREVKEELQNTLYYNLPRARIENTVYPEPLESEKTYDKLKDKNQEIQLALVAGKKPDWPKQVPDDTFEMNRMRLDVDSPKSDLKAAFVYQREWPMLINVEPSDGGILTTAKMKGASKYLRFLCLNQWHFAYDLIYPVKLVIRDDDAFNGDGFLFQMAFPVIIRDNMESRLSFGLRKFTVPDMSAPDFCENFGTTPVDIRVLGFTESSPIAVDLEDAEVNYRCVNKECVLGKTYSDGSGAIRLNTFLPEGCGNPVISAKKEGYLENKKATQGQEKVEIMLTRLKKLPYSIVVHPYYEEVNKDDPTKARNQEWLTAQTYSRFTKTMHATVTVSLRNSSFEQYLIYPASSTSYSGTEENYDLPAKDNASDEVEFVLGNAQYDIDLLLMKGETVVGGYHAENVTITYDDLAQANNVLFHVVEYRPLPSDPKEQAGMFVFLYDRGKLDDQPYWKALKPTFT